jgi:hypothetical protein
VGKHCTLTFLDEHFYPQVNNATLAPADVLGVVGKYGVGWAALWAPPGTSTASGPCALRTVHNFDGHGATFGTQCVRASSSNQGQLSIYAALHPDGTLTAVVINKTTSALSSPVIIRGNPPTATAAVSRPDSIPGSRPAGDQGWRRSS